LGAGAALGRYRADLDQFIEASGQQFEGAERSLVDGVPRRRRWCTVCGTERRPEPAGFGYREVDVGAADRLELRPCALRWPSYSDLRLSLPHQVSELAHAAIAHGCQQILVVGEMAVRGIVRHARLPRYRSQDDGV